MQPSLKAGILSHPKLQVCMTKSDKKTIGRIEKIDFPELSIFNLDAKVDTGAYTSSLHCQNIRQITENGQELVEFNVLDSDHPEYEDKLFRCLIHDIRKVKSSNGETEKRFVIKQKVQFFKKLRTIELSLTDRSAMKYPVLLGRKFLKKFVVDISRKYISETN